MSKEIDKDWIERDRLLTEINTSLKALDKTVITYIAEDKMEHKTLKKRVFILTVSVVIIGVILGGPSFAMMFIK